MPIVVERSLLKQRCSSGFKRVYSGKRKFGICRKGVTKKGLQNDALKKGPLKRGLQNDALLKKSLLKRDLVVNASVNLVIPIL